MNYKAIVAGAVVFIFTEDLVLASLSQPSETLLAQTSPLLKDDSIDESSAPEGKLTIVAPQRSQKESVSPYSFKYRSYTALNSQGFQNIPGSDQEAYVWDRLYLNYAFNKTLTFSLMPQFHHTWFGDRDRPQSGSTVGLNQPYAAYADNPALILTDSELASLGNDFILDSQIRYDIPLSETSMARGSFGETWVTFGVTKNLGKWEFRYYEIIRNYLQQSKTSSVMDAKTSLPLQNPYIKVYSLIDASFHITHKLSINLETGFLNEGRYADPSTGRSGVMLDYFVLSPEISYTFNDNVSLNLGIFETPNMGQLTSQYIPLSSDIQNEGEAFLLLTIKI